MPPEIHESPERKSLSFKGVCIEVLNAKDVTKHLTSFIRPPIYLTL